MTDISVQKIKIAFEQGTDILRGVTFDVTAGEHVGILGRNGAGKTTLFRIITGELSPDEGQVVTAPGKRIGVLSQIPVYPDGFTGEDVLKTAQQRVFDMEKEMRDIEKRLSEGEADPAELKRYDHLSSEFLRLGGYELKRFRDMVANGLGIPDIQREQLFSELSGGERTRLNLARLILEDTDILLLDEPTNHLDMSAAEWLEEHISRFKGTVLTISHDRYFLDKTAQRIIEIADGQAEFYSGNYSFYLEEKQRRYEERLRKYEKEQAKIAQLQKAADDLHLWAFMGNDKLHKRAFSIEKRIEKMAVTEKPKAEAKMKTRFGERDFHGDEVLCAKSVAKSFGDRTLFHDLDLVIEPGERVALIGDNGTGKSTLVKMIMNEETTDYGYIRIGPAVKTAYLPQMVTFEDENLSVLECMMYEGRCTQQQARDRLAAYLFRGEDVFTQVSQLSGGEKSRLKLCMLMKSDINFLILDEPTNHLDAASREWIEEALSDYSEALLFVSHDRYFINRFATRIWEISGGELHDYRCGYERYRSILERQQITARQQTEPEKKEKPVREKKKPAYSKDKQLARLEREIAALEGKVRDNETAQEQNASDYARLMELTAQHEEMDKELEKLYSQWEELAQ
ncbi:MAG: ribosomal protection-like ABC-F family protein [Oscillospiraceae bacterium]